MKYKNRIKDILQFHSLWKFNFWYQKENMGSFGVLQTHQRCMHCWPLKKSSPYYITLILTYGLNEEKKKFY